MKVENTGKDSVSEVLLVFPERQAKNLAYLTAVSSAGKGKAKASAVNLPVENVNSEGMPPTLVAYSVSLPEGGLGKGASFTFDVSAVFSYSLQPFPEKITQADTQLLVFEESAYFLSPYAVKVQSLTVKLPHPRVESYTKLENTKIHGSEIKYGPYEDLAPFSYSAIVVHFESNQPFVVARELVREIEVSHWGNVQVTENYNLVHGGSQIKGEFSRFDYVFHFFFFLLSSLVSVPNVSYFLHPAGLITRPDHTLEVHQLSEILLQSCLQELILFITGMQLATFQLLIFGVILER